MNATATRKHHLNRYLAAAAAVCTLAGAGQLHAQDVIDYQASNDGTYGTTANWENSDLPDEGYGGSSAARGEYAQFDGSILGASPLTVTVDGGPYTISGFKVVGGADIVLNMNLGTPLVTNNDAFGTPLEVAGAGSSLTITNGTFDADGGADKAFTVSAGAGLTIDSTGVLAARFISNHGEVVVENGGQFIANTGNGFTGGSGHFLIKGGEVVAKNVSFSEGAVLEFELNNSDYTTARFRATNRIDNGLGDLAISLASGFSANLNDEFMLVTSTNLSANGVDSFDNLAHGETITAGAYTFTLDVANSGRSYKLITTAVPEPASLALLGLGGLAMFGRRRQHA